MKHATLWQTENAFNNASIGLARPHVSYIREDNHVYFIKTKDIPEGFVDLGLPSGTLWSTKNLGATNADTSTSWYGNYYAWGETGTKSDYSWATYQHANGSQNTLTKYCNNSEYGKDGYIDSLSTLEPEDDAAYVASNGVWRMPAEADFEELIARTSNEWVTDYNDIPDLKGRVFKSKINGNEMFIPAAGYYRGSDLSSVADGAHLWSSGLNTDSPRRAWRLYFYSDDIRMNSYYRYYGLSVRPVL